MANRHKMAKKNVGGAMVASGNPNVIKEAKQKNRGGALVKARKDGGKVSGYKSGGRLDKRARGGGVGADKNPFSSAKVKG